jgi:hypothetical protein
VEVARIELASKTLSKESPTCVVYSRYRHL